MTLQDAIQLAMEAGYSSDALDESFDLQYADAYILQDLAFWQFLGKARGWLLDDRSVRFGNEHPDLTARFEGVAYTKGTWNYHALRYFETLLSSGSTEDFWKSLP